MLQACPTTKGTGIVLYGDYADLYNLYTTFQKLFKEDTEIERERTRILTIMSYEIRHAYQGDRLVKKIAYDADNIVSYYGCRIDWITLLYTISCLRDHAGFVILDELDHANLLLLEYWCKKALFEYDAQGANTIQNFINARINTHDKFVYLIHQEIVNQFFRMKPGKNRFRRIPELLLQYGYNMPAYKSLEMHINTMLQQSDTISDIESNFPDIDIQW